MRCANLRALKMASWKFFKPILRSTLPLFAERQTRGRGRQEREWVSPVGNLYLTLGFRVDRHAKHPWPFVSLLAGIAAARSLKHLQAWDEHCLIKWPNDLYRIEVERVSKFGGILTELRKDILLIGIGINIETAPPLSESSYSATSLNDFAAQKPSASELGQTIATTLKPLFETWMASTDATTTIAIDELSRIWMKPFFSLKGHVEGIGEVRATRLFEDGRLCVASLQNPQELHTIASGEFRFVI